MLCYKHNQEHELNIAELALTEVSSATFVWGQQMARNISDVGAGIAVHKIPAWQKSLTDISVHKCSKNDETYFVYDARKNAPVAYTPLYKVTRANSRYVLRDLRTNQIVFRDAKIGAVMKHAEANLPHISTVKSTQENAHVG